MAYDGNYSRSQAGEASVTIYFTGTRLDVIGMLGTTVGLTDFYLDGVLIQTKNLKSGTAHYQQTVWSTGTLSAGAHYVTIQRSASESTSQFITLDAVDIWGTITSAP